MKVVFVSNYFNHHQKPFCDAMYQKLGKDFTFIATSTMREERRKLGYAQDVSPEYVLLSYENNDQYRKALDLIYSADAVIAGSAPNRMLLKRIARGKLLLRYSERPFKKEPFLLRRIYHAFSLRAKNLFRKKNIYMLCAGAYAASDYASLGMYKNHMFKWGYFPDTKEYDIDALLAQKKKDTILWCGRFIDWKHPDDAIRVAKMLKENGYHFQLDLIGTGTMEDGLHQMVKQYGLDDCIHFLGSMPPEQVRKHMEKAGIYLFTSDRQEGWGAVLNEAMNSACAVVACEDIGSVSYILNNNIDGLAYRSGNIEMLYQKIRYIFEHSGEHKCLGKMAYCTILNDWSASTAADRICAITEHILSGKQSVSLYENGIGSNAL